MASLAVVHDIHSPRSLDAPDAAAAFQEDLFAEFVLARSAHGAADATVRAELAAVTEFLAWAGCYAWEVEPGDGDRFLAKAQRDKASQGAARQGGQDPADEGESDRDVLPVLGGAIRARSTG